jgi:ubiquitin-like protein Pup
MARQEQTRHSNRTRTPDETHGQEMEDLADEAAAARAKQSTGVATADVATDWLDDIDEELAQAFVDSFVQKGGQ